MYELECADGYGGKAVNIVTYKICMIVCDNLHSLTPIAIIILQLIHDRQLHFGWISLQLTAWAIQTCTLIYHTFYQKNNHDNQNRNKTYNTTWHDNMLSEKSNERPKTALGNNDYLSPHAMKPFATRTSVSQNAKCWHDINVRQRSAYFACSCWIAEAKEFIASLRSDCLYCCSLPSCHAKYEKFKCILCWLVTNFRDTIWFSAEQNGLAVLQWSQQCRFTQTNRLLCDALEQSVIHSKKIGLELVQVRYLVCFWM